MSGVERAHELLRDKFRANAALYAGLPPLGSAALNMATETRQTARCWGRRQQARARVSATNRDRVSINVIADHTPRERLSPKPAPRHPDGMKHAWQRKAAGRSAVQP